MTTAIEHINSIQRTIDDLKKRVEFDIDLEELATPYLKDADDILGDLEEAIREAS